MDQKPPGSGSQDNTHTHGGPTNLTPTSIWMRIGPPPPPPLPGLDSLRGWHWNPPPYISIPTWNSWHIYRGYRLELGAEKGFLRNFAHISIFASEKIWYKYKIMLSAKFTWWLILAKINVIGNPTIDLHSRHGNMGHKMDGWVPWWNMLRVDGRGNSGRQHGHGEG